jgi:hypothetical protein
MKWQYTTQRLPLFRKLIRNLFALDVVFGSGFFLWNHRYLTLKIKLHLLAVCGSTDTIIKIRSQSDNNQEEIATVSEIDKNPVYSGLVISIM